MEDARSHACWLQGEGRRPRSDSGEEGGRKNRSHESRLAGNKEGSRPCIHEFRIVGRVGEFAPTGTEKVLAKGMTRELERQLSNANRLPSDFDVAENRA